MADAPRTQDTSRRDVAGDGDGLEFALRRQTPSPSAGQAVTDAAGFYPIFVNTMRRSRRSLWAHFRSGELVAEKPRKRRTE